MLHHITTKHHRPIGVLLIALGILVVILFALGVATTKASDFNGNANVYGAAWSSNIGWISFNNCLYDPLGENCSTYSTPFGVRIDPTSGEFSGAAWSSNIGWISFNQADTSVCSSLQPAKVLNMQNAIATGSSPVVGWARALNPNQGSNGDGFWNGCISLSSTNTSNFGNNPLIPYGVTFNYNSSTLSTLTGNAWGDEVLGWISFAGNNHSVNVDLVDIDTPFVSLLANQTSIIIGQSSTLTLTTQNIGSCEIGSVVPVLTPPNPTEWPLGAGVPISGYQHDVHPIVDTTYEIICFPSDQITYPSPVNDFATVTIIPPPTTVFLQATYNDQNGQQPAEFPPNLVPYDNFLGGYFADLSWWTTATNPPLHLSDCTLKGKNGNANWAVINSGYGANPSPLVLDDQEVFPPQTLFQLTGCENTITGTTYDSNVVTLKPAVPNPTIDFGSNECINPNSQSNNVAPLHLATTDILSCMFSDGNQSVQLTGGNLNFNFDVSPSITTTYTVNSCVPIQGGTVSTPNPVVITVDENCVDYCDEHPDDPICLPTNPNPRPIFEEF